MAHLVQHTAIFSPSVARAAASTAKDWSYVDGWLKTKYRGRSVPAFERNADTLRALLSLAAHNEAADEEREHLAHIEAAALEEVEAAAAEKERRRKERRQQQLEAEAGEKGRVDEGGSLDGELIADDILNAIEAHLTREGRTALETMANVAVELGVAHPEPAALGSRFVELQGRALQLEHATERVALLQRYLDRESTAMEALIAEVRGPEYRPEPDLARQNLDLQRQVRTMAAKLPELRQHLITVGAATGDEGSPTPTAAAGPRPSVEEVKRVEQDYLELLAKKKDLDSQVKAFAGLPPYLDAARAELEALRMELRNATQRRDNVFEGLVERESPAKPKRRF
ncbi:hypothetical protein BX600DRAFT_160603 [Xylariales sp. PMI_506]|nr:hypothetical protein BX600DRAFT_160603 [Xylariales sp. PMI_506]